MPHQTFLASAMVASIVTGATFATASVMALQAMGIWIGMADV